MAVLSEGLQPTHARPEATIGECPRWRRPCESATARRRGCPHVLPQALHLGLYAGVPRPAPCAGPAPPGALRPAAGRACCLILRTRGEADRFVDSRLALGGNPPSPSCPPRGWPACSPVTVGRTGRRRGRRGGCEAAGFLPHSVRPAGADAGAAGQPWPVHSARATAAARCGDGADGRCAAPVPGLIQPTWRCGCGPRRHIRPGRPPPGLLTAGYGTFPAYSGWPPGWPAGRAHSVRTP